MAPPSPRRPGFSRRAQYSLFTGYVIAVVGIVVGLLLLITARFDPDGNAAIQRTVSDIFSPISSLARQVLGEMGSAGEEISAYFDAASKNRAMKQELEASRQALIAGKAAELENRRLKRLLLLAERSDTLIVTARLVSSTGSLARRYATLDAGSTQGVRNGLPVVAPDGLVGRVVQTGLISARVLLIVDAGNIVPVKRLSDGAPGLANGLGDGRIEIRPLTPLSDPFKLRDIFVTSGIGGIYRPGVPVAIGLKQNRDGVTARPLADPARFDFALVEREYVAAPPPLPAAPAKGS